MKNFVNVLNERSFGHRSGSVYQESQFFLEHGLEMATNVALGLGLALWVSDRRPVLSALFARIVCGRWGRN